MQQDEFTLWLNSDDAEIREWRTFIPKWNIYLYHTPSFQDSEIIVEEGSERVAKLKVVDDYKVTVSAGHNVAVVHMKSQ